MPDQPGAQGLDDPAVLRDLIRPAMGLVGPRFALGSLERTPEEIDSRAAPLQRRPDLPHLTAG